MWRIVFLSLVLLSSNSFAQMQETTKAIKVDEFETATYGYVRFEMDGYFTQLANNASAQGYIINYGTAKEIFLRQKLILHSITARKYDPSRITMMAGGFRGIIETELWIVPPGAEIPQPESKATKIDEFGKVRSGDLKSRLDNFFIHLANNSNQQGYVVNYGSTKAVSIREKLIKNYISILKFDLSRIKFFNDSVSKEIKTEFWVDSSNSDKPKN